MSFQLETKGNPNNIGLVPLKKEQLLIHAGKKAFLYDYTLQVTPKFLKTNKIPEKD